MDRNTQMGILLRMLRAARKSSPEHLHHLGYLLQEGARTPTGYRFGHRCGPHARDLEDNLDRPPHPTGTPS